MYFMSKCMDERSGEFATKRIIPTIIKSINCTQHMRKYIHSGIWITRVFWHNRFIVGNFTLYRNENSVNNPDIYTLYASI